MSAQINIFANYIKYVNKNKHLDLAWKEILNKENSSASSWDDSDVFFCPPDVHRGDDIISFCAQDVRAERV